jgi:hypothetical protein
MARGPIRGLVGVYDADGSVRGELAYFIGARLGRAHCALCDITHGLLRERDDWKACRAALPVPFDTYHRDDQPEAVRTAAAGRAPVVLVDTEHGLEVLLGPDALEACDGSVAALSAGIDAAVRDRGLEWPVP